MNDGSAQHLVVVGDFAVTVMAGHAVVAVDLPGGEVFYPIQGDEITTFEEGIFLQNLTALQLPEDVLEQRTELTRLDLIEDSTHLGVAWDGFQAEDRAEVVIQCSALKGQQGRILEGKQGQSSHQGVSQSERRAAPLLGKFLHTAADQFHQRIKVEVTTLMPLGGSLAHGNTSESSTAAGFPQSIPYENRLG
jgi:hypothetical protein